MIESLIETDSITIYFQPIVSVRHAKIIGFEALTRAFDENGDMLSPVFLFNEAKKENLSFELDRYVRRKALLTFQKHYQKDSSLLLFLNFESHLLDNDLDFSKFAFCDIVKELHIPSKNVVLEIKENEVRNNTNLKCFCDHYKELGFIIALDDFGAGSSNFDRLSIVRPHIVKIDRSLIFNLHQNFINKEIVRAITNMCFNIGALVLSEGVEKEEEVVKSLRLDIDLFQGYWFGKPAPTTNHKPELINKIHYIGEMHSNNVKQTINKKERLIELALTYATNIITSLQTVTKHNLKKYLETSDDLEAIYIIHATTGIQIGNTIIDSLENRFFHPAKDGDDHSLKEYFYITKESKRGSFLSEKYISRATGTMCRTFAQKFILEETPYILCLDLKASTFLNYQRF